MNKELFFLNLCNYFEEIENISSRTDMTNALVELFEETPVEDIQRLVYLILGRVAPFYIKSEFNIGEKILINVFDEIFKKDAKIEFLNTGDIGITFYNYQSDIRSDYSFEFVFNTLVDISNISGKDATKVKKNIIFNFLKNASPLEGKFFSRILLSKLRLGFSDRTILDALSKFSKGDKLFRLKIEEAYAKCSDLGIVAKTVVSDINNLDKLSVTLGIPIFAKLVERSSNIDDGIKRFGEVFVQPKFDGLRCQIHILNNSEVKLFSRNLNDITEMFPDFVANIKDLNLKNAIFDSEIIGVDETTKKFLAFQDTVKMKRKNKSNNNDDNQVIKAFIFDLIYLNTKSFLNEPLKNRLILLNNIFEGKEYKNISLAETKTFDNSEDIYDYFERNINNGLEGVVIKNPKSIYTPGIRNFDWLKLKKDSIKGVVDTIDAVIMGYYKGAGSRAKLGIGGVLVGIYNKSQNKFETICKLGSGFSESELLSLKSSLDKIKISDPDKFYTYNKDIIPDLWVEPKFVIVIRSDEITKSPMHTAGKLESKDNKGYALRFPRFISFRDDKTIYDSTSTDEVSDIYKISRKNMI